MTALAQTPYQPLRASDADRENTAALLRDAWLNGRLETGELEQRVEEAFGARTTDDLWHAVRELPMPLPPPEPFPALAAFGLTCSLLGAVVFALSFGLLSFLALPLAATGWLTSRTAARRPGTRGHSTAKAGEVFGLMVTVGSGLLLTGCGAVVVAVN